MRRRRGGHANDFNVLGVIVQMYWSDHPPSHIHAYYAGFEAMFEIKSGKVIGGGLPHKVEKLVRDWVLARQAELMQNWERGRSKLPFYKVPGADA